MDEDDVERPAGVAIVAVLIVLTALASVVARLRGADFGVRSCAWLVVHVASIVVAFGLWTLKRWAYWLFIALAVGGIATTIGRLVTQQTAYGPAYHAVRIGIAVAWLLYFARWQVRAAFAPPGSGYGR